MKTALLMVTLAAAVSFAACSKKEETTTTHDAPPPRRTRAGAVDAAGRHDTGAAVGTLPAMPRRLVGRGSPRCAAPRPPQRRPPRALPRVK